MELTDLFTFYRMERPSYSILSVREMLTTIRLFSRFMSHAPTLADLTKQNILAFMATFPGDYTANKHRVNLICLWNHAAEEELLAPPPKIKKRIEPEREPICWTLEELQTIFATADLIEGDWQGVPIRLCWKIAVGILYDTGCRIGTLHKANLQELNLSSGVWTVPAEHMKRRRKGKVYQLHASTVALVKQSLTTQRRKLWPFPFEQRTAYRHLERLLILANLPADHLHKFHCIRKTAESYAAASKGIEWAAEAIGHSPAVARKHYISKSICKPPALIDGLPQIF